MSIDEKEVRTVGETKYVHVVAGEASIIIIDRILDLYRDYQQYPSESLLKDIAFLLDALPEVGVVTGYSMKELEDKLEALIISANDYMKVLPSLINDEILLKVERFRK